jgi:hypothetical protein
MRTSFPSRNGRPRYHVTLRFPTGLKNCGFLSVELNGKLLAKVELENRFALLLLVLYEARKADAPLADEAPQGLRSREQVSKAIDEITKSSVDVGTISTYAWTLQRRLADALRRGKYRQPVDLVERRKNRGYRLSDDIDLDVIL